MDYRALVADITEGKTKIIYPHSSDSSLVFIENKDDITAGNGKKHDVISSKGQLSTGTTVNCFELLRLHHIATHLYSYNPFINGSVFTAWNCKMIPLEVVIRRYVMGSFCKRNPNFKKGEKLDDLVVEFFLKDDKNNDPYLQIDDFTHVVKVYQPDKPIKNSKFTLLSISEIFSHKDYAFNMSVIDEMKHIAVEVFSILEKALDSQDCKLLDLKIELGFCKKTGKLLVADVIDNDSWRILDKNGNERSKQIYRDGASLEKVKNAYLEIFKVTNKFLD